MADKQTTVSVRELKAKASELLRRLDEAPGDEIVITRHGKPCAKLVSLKRNPQGIPWSERISLRDAWPKLHKFSDVDFQEAKRIWEPKIDAGS